MRHQDPHRNPYRRRLLQDAGIALAAVVVFTWYVVGWWGFGW